MAGKSCLRGSLLQQQSISKSVGQRTLFTRRKKPPTRIGSALWTSTGLILTGGFLYYAHDSRASIHSWLAIPVLHALTADDPEKSHKIAIRVLESGLAPKDKVVDDPVLAFELWGKHFSNPVGMAAGFDKHGEAIDGIFDLGFGYVEIGSVTPVPQEGNPKPRFFRLPSSESVINRYGFNSEGSLVMLGRLRSRIRHFVHANSHLLPSTLFPILPAGSDPDPRPLARLLSSEAGSDATVPDLLSTPRSLKEGKILAINLGKNKVSAPDSIDDFVNGVKQLGPYADVLVINVSSPNTPGLRSLQKRGMLGELLSSVVTARNGLKGDNKPPVVVKIAPDLNEEELDDIASAAKETKIDGIIISNTTLSRPGSAGSDPQIKEAGGLSGPPLKPLSLTTLAALYRTTGGEIPLIGCGGINTGKDALDYARAGASFVQLYTALGYQGVGLPRRIKDQITTELKAEGTTWSKVVGSGVKLPSRAELEKEAVAKKQKVEERERVAFNSSIQELKGELDQVLKQIAEAERKAEQPMPEMLVQETGEPSTVAAITPTSAEGSISSGIVEDSSLAAASEPAKPSEAKTSPTEELKKIDTKKQPFVFTIPLYKLGSSFGQRGRIGEEGKRLV